MKTAHLLQLADQFETLSVKATADGVTFDPTWLEAANSLRTMAAMSVLFECFGRMGWGPFGRPRFHPVN